MKNNEEIQKDLTELAIKGDSEHLKQYINNNKVQLETIIKEHGPGNQYLFVPYQEVYKIPNSKLAYIYQTCIEELLGANSLFEDQ